jgi:hypothetical protein
MGVFVGHKGSVRVGRGIGPAYSIEATISSDDVNTTLNRLGVDGSVGSLLTGDRVLLRTEDARGLACFPSGAWPNGTVQADIALYVNVNPVGGLRFFSSFADAVNNVRANEVALATFAGGPLSTVLQLQNNKVDILGNVTSYTLNTDREALDTTSLSDRFKRQYSAGLISGNGTIDCLFDNASSGVKEVPLLMLQIIQRLEIGSNFDLALYLVDSTYSPSQTNVYYELSASVVRTGITVEDDGVIGCTIDFVTDGDINLRVGDLPGYLLQEDDGRIQLEQSLGFLLTEIAD